MNYKDLHKNQFFFFFRIGLVPTNFVLNFNLITNKIIKPGYIKLKKKLLKYVNTDNELLLMLTLKKPLLLTNKLFCQFQNYK